MEQDIFSDEEELQAEQVADTIEEPQQHTEVVDDGQPRDDKGRFAPKGETEGASPAPVEEQPPFEHAAVLAERRRRQEAEERARALEEQLQAFNKPEPVEPPSIWEDDNAALQYVQQNAVQQAVQQATLNARLDMSEMLARQANPDFEEVKEEFLALGKDNPALVQQALSDPHPWNKAYQIAKNARTMRELGATNVAELEAKLREKIIAEQQAQRPAAPALPNSLADAPSGRGGAVNTGPAAMTLQDIIGR